MLSFTCDEAWRMYRPNAEPSVHLTLFPEGFEKFRDDALAAKWETIRNVRRVVTGALELERAAKNIGSSLEASPVIYVADKADASARCSTSTSPKSASPRTTRCRRGGAGRCVPSRRCAGVAVVVEKAIGIKCARSWKILPTVGEDAEYPDVSPRDAQALREWKALGVAV